MRSRVVSSGLGAVLMVLLVFAETAAAVPVSGSVADEQDARPEVLADGRVRDNPDLKRLSVSYDSPTGSITATVELWRPLGYDGTCQWGQLSFTLGSRYNSAGDCVADSAGDPTMVIYFHGSSPYWPYAGRRRPSGAIAGPRLAARPRGIGRRSLRRSWRIRRRIVPTPACATYGSSRAARTRPAASVWAPARASGRLREPTPARRPCGGWSRVTTRSCRASTPRRRVTGPAGTPAWSTPATTWASTIPTTTSTASSTIGRSVPRTRVSGTREVPDGRHTLTVVAYDRAGNSARSTITVTVRNAGVRAPTPAAPPAALGTPGGPGAPLTPPPSGGGGDARASLVGRLSGATTLRTLVRQGLRVRVQCPAACRASVRLTVSRSLARRLRTETTLARGARRLSSAGTVRLRPPRRAVGRRLLRRSRTRGDPASRRHADRRRDAPLPTASHTAPVAHTRGRGRLRLARTNGRAVRRAPHGGGRARLHGPRRRQGARQWSDRAVVEAVEARATA